MCACRLHVCVGEVHVIYISAKCYYVIFDYRNSVCRPSVIFTARCIMHSADYAVVRCLSVCLSLCLSVTRQYYVETAKHIIINAFLATSGSQTRAID